MINQLWQPKVESAVDRLASEFNGIFAMETVRRCALESLSLYREARIEEFVPLLVYRLTRERLLAAVQVEGKLAKTVPEVLFVCVHNAGRSQIAAAFTQALSDGRVHVRSAGSTPASEITPAVVDAMREMGLDLSQEFPKPLTDEVVEAAAAVTPALSIPGSATRTGTSLTRREGR
jgi:Protein-tyrosine-phosphatase-like, N-terminal domain/Low molecular weight phosphotyrosine protein phosphatase